MDFDVDLMRELLLDLETRQNAPRSTVVLSVDEAAMVVGRSTSAVEASLTALLDLDYIEGPGVEFPGFFLFRKLTRKGIEFVKTTRHPRDWADMKRHFAKRRREGNV